MEIIFKDDTKFYYIYGRCIKMSKIEDVPNKDLSNIKNLDDNNILYHYRNDGNGHNYPVYYEHNGKFITKNFQGYTIFWCMDHYIKDYSLVNLKLLEDENII